MACTIAIPPLPRARRSMPLVTIYFNGAMTERARDAARKCAMDREKRL
jgi:hypothetical protein